MTPPAPKDEYEGKRRFEGGLLSRLLSYAWPQKLLLGISLLLFPLAAAAQLGQPFVLKQVLDGPIKEGDAPGIAPYAFVFIGLVLGHGVLQFTQNVLMTLAGQRIMRAIRLQLFRRVLRLPPAFFDRTPTGKVLTRLTGDVESLNEFLSSGLVTVVADTVLLIGIVGSMLWLNWKLALISFVLLPPFVFALARMRGYMRQLFRALRNRSTALNTFVNENVVGMLVVQAFRREAKNDEQHEDLTYSLYDESMRALWFSSMLSAGVQLAETLTLALLLWAALGGLLAEAAVSAGLVVAFVDYVQRFYAPIENLSGRYTILQNALASAEKIFTLMDEPDELPDPAAPLTLEPLKTGLSLENVTFRYQTGEIVLDKVTLHVPKGQTVALVGATGAGKSTVVKLLGRFYDPQEGEVTWDGTDLRAFRANDLRQRLAYVPQETFLFSETLAHNVGLGREDQAAVERASQAIGVDQVAADLPSGYAQVLGERGHDLSAGERQLVSFARALARDPDVLILDEATANVDGATEAKIQKALETLLAGRTAVVIAHRLSTIKKADRIVVLHKGKIREQGTHEELLEQQGLYWTLYRLQSEEAA